METLPHTTVTRSAYPNSIHKITNPFTPQTSNYTFAFATNSHAYPSKKLSFCNRKSVTVAAKKNNKKQDKHSFVPKPDEATGPFPEAVLLKEKKVQEDGRLLPEFADAEEEELYQFLNLEMDSQQKVDRMRHYEVVYLIHEKHAEEVDNVVQKVQDFLGEKRGRIWRFNDWGMRRLAYKIQKATHAHYILMNFEIEAKWINDFKTMLDQDERVIRHLVIKRDEAITEDCPPPPEFHTLRAGMDDDEEDDLEYDDDEDGFDDWDAEGEMEDGIIVVDDDKNDDGSMEWNDEPTLANDRGKRTRVHEKVGRR